MRSDPRFPAALDDGRRFFDQAGYEDRPHKASPWQPGDREAFARAYAQIATALPERPLYALRPRSGITAKPCLIRSPEELTTDIHRIAGGR